MEPAEPILIVSPRYADEVAQAVAATGMVPRIERRPELAGERFDAEPMRVVVVDSRGALAQGMAVARAIGPAVEARRGALLVLLSRADGGATAMAHDAGATSVLVSPFGGAALGNALRLTARHARRLADAATERDGGEGGSHDLLTGLATGDQLQGWVATLLDLPQRPAELFVLAVGVGRFAQINAAYGRAVADRVLGFVALRLGAIVDGRTPGHALGEVRLLARLAAAEFAVAMAGPLALDDANRLAAAIIGAFEAPFVVDDHIIRLSARVGIAACDAASPGSGDDDVPPAGGVSAAALLIRRASAALTQARAGESGTIEVFAADPAGDRLTRMADLEADLHDAIANDDITLLFQPQLALASGRIAAVEALVRWEHPGLGLLSAETLLETAASAELAIKLGRYIRARAMTIAARWTGSLGRLRLSVNVTAADLADPGFAEALEQAIATSGFPRQRVILEVTEGALIEDMRSAVNLLGALRNSGIRVALDDFGTGYSSLAWLARLPVDAIKLDRSFTLGLTGSARERVVVETVVRLSKQLGLNVVAEGVEDDNQFEAVRLAGCDSVQGYQVAAPLGEAALAVFCADWAARELVD